MVMVTLNASNVVLCARRKNVGKENEWIFRVFFVYLCGFRVFYVIYMIGVWLVSFEKGTSDRNMLSVCDEYL